jgi:hypothetical protein
MLAITKEEERHLLAKPQKLKNGTYVPCNVSQYEFYRNHGAADWVLETVARNSRSFGAAAESSAIAQFRLGKRVSSRHDGILEVDGKQYHVEIKASRWWSATRGLAKFQHIERNYHADIYLFMILDFQGWCMYAITPEHVQKYLTRQGKQGEWVLFHDIKHLLCRIHDEEGLKLFAYMADFMNQ